MNVNCSQLYPLKTELGPIRGNGDVAHYGDLAPVSVRIAVDGRDYGLWDVLNAAKHPGVCFDELR